MESLSNFDSNKGKECESCNNCNRLVLNQENPEKPINLGYRGIINIQREKKGKEESTVERIVTF